LLAACTPVVGYYTICMAEPHFKSIVLLLVTLSSIPEAGRFDAVAIALIDVMKAVMSMSWP